MFIYFFNRRDVILVSLIQLMEILYIICRSRYSNLKHPTSPQLNCGNSLDYLNRQKKSQWINFLSTKSNLVYSFTFWTLTQKYTTGNTLLFYCNLKLKRCLDQIQWQKRNPNLKIRFQVSSFNTLVSSMFCFTNTNILITLESWFGFCFNWLIN